jgi:hypothetical protein
MIEATDSASDGDSPFDALDPRLTVFALANGMDLAKGEGYRRLEWFTEGLERGILIEATDSPSFDVKVLCWKTGNAETLSGASVGEGLSAEEVSSLVSGAIDTANGLSA